MKFFEFLVQDLDPTFSRTRECKFLAVSGARETIEQVIFLQFCALHTFFTLTIACNVFDTVKCIYYYHNSQGGVSYGPGLISILCKVKLTSGRPVQ